MSVGSASEAGPGAGGRSRFQTPCRGRQGVEIGVVAAGIAGQAHVEGMVKVVAPLCRQAVAAAFSRRDQPGSFKSDSAMSGIGRRRKVLRAETSMFNSSSRCVARVSCSACTASRRSPST